MVYETSIIMSDDGRFANSTELSELLEDFQGGEVINLRVGTNIRHRRLDKYVNGRLVRFSRNLIQKMVKNGAITVNDNEVKSSHQINPGDIVRITLPEPQPKEITPEDIPLDIIYEDDDMIAVNKQADLIIHPARGFKTGTLVNALVHYADSLSKGTYHYRPGIVHRLDRNTTGVVVVAKNDIAQYKLADQFQNRTTEKTYLAIVHGNPELDADRIRNRLGIHPSVREKFAVRPDIGKEAITVYHVLERFKGFALLEIKILTGRTHQIRVHMSHIKHPIVGDDMYGGKPLYKWHICGDEAVAEEPVMPRCALHAWKLCINHPKTDQRMELEAPLPEDMRQTLELLRKYRPLDKEKPAGRKF
jgi:23S rRNA pseudouridine1911/1915/1917 synthase